MEGIDISVKKTGLNNEISVVIPKGFIDSQTLPVFQEALSGVINSGCHKLVVNFESLDFISSAGMGVLISALGELKARGGDVKLVGMGPEIYNMFELLGLHYVFHILPNEDQALKELKGG